VDGFAYRGKWRNVPVIRMPANSKQQKKLVRLISALSDMAWSINAADLILAGAPDELREHLFLSMVVAYGRPFTENYGVGRIQCDYPNYPDFGDTDMPLRHARLLDIRNKFTAHSSAEGTRVLIIPPDVPNPLGDAPKGTFDFNVGKRVFRESQFIEWLRIAPTTFKERLHADIRQLLAEAFGGDSELQKPFELTTGHENFKWT